MTTTIGAALRKIFGGQETLNLASFDTAPPQRTVETADVLAHRAAEAVERTRQLRTRELARTYPQGAEQPCTKCAGVLIPSGPVHVDEGDAAAVVALVCTNDCGVQGVHYWEASDEQYEAMHGHPFDHHDTGDAE